MSASALSAVETLRAEQRRRMHGAMIPRLWRAVQGEFQRMRDRATAHVVNRLDHAGVSADDHLACRRR